MEKKIWEMPEEGENFNVALRQDMVNKQMQAYVTESTMSWYRGSFFQVDQGRLT